MRLLLRLSCLLGLGLAPMAGEGLRGPVTGYIFDARHSSIRAIQGIPGAAALGGALAIGTEVSRCELHSKNRIALCLGKEDSGWLSIHWTEAGTVRVKKVPELTGAVTRILFNAKGDAAVVHSAGIDGEAGRLQWFRGFPDGHNVSGDVEVGAEARLLNVDANGSRALVFEDGRLLSADAEKRTEHLATGVKIAAAMFTAEGGVLFADAGTGEIWRLEKAESGAEAVRLLGAEDGVTNPVALAYYGKDAGRSIVVVDGGSAELAIVGLAERRVERMPLFGRASRLASLDGEDVYALNEAGDRPLLLLDCRAHSAFFVPLD